MKFSTRLENLLEERNLTQKALSTELNIAASTLNGYLRQNREPDYETLINLGKFFGVSITITNWKRILLTIKIKNVSQENPAHKFYPFT